MRPDSDWLPFQNTFPARLPWRNSPENQNLPESAGSTQNPMATVTAKTRLATPACRYRRVTSRYGMKISGVSLIPAARPTPMP